MNITKRAVREALSGKDADVARFFGVTAGAVSQWADEEPLPEGRQWQAVALRPDLFGPASDPTGKDSDGRVVAFGAGLDDSEVGKAVALGSN